VAILLQIIAGAAGLAVGGLAGYAVGRRVVADRRAFWWAAGLGVAACVGVDMAALAIGANWLTVGSLGVMAGWLTGLKYGGIAEIRVWDSEAAEQVAAKAAARAASEEGADASPDDAVPTPEGAGTGGAGRTVTD
jgi:hypothetical protein